MDRKTLIAIISALSLLVILLLVHFNQQALAPMPESTISATAGGPIRPSVAGILDMPENTSFSMNLTNITPTAEQPRPSAQALPHHTAVTATPVPPTSTPQPSAMTPWPPMSPMIPMTPAPTSSWNDTLRR